mgnify:CR=1 FL=1
MAHGNAPSRTPTGLGTAPGSRGVSLALSATQRFERLSDRLELLILSETKEFLAEKDALVSTVGLNSPTLLTVTYTPSTST